MLEILSESSQTDSESPVTIVVTEIMNYMVDEDVQGKGLLEESQGNVLRDENHENGLQDVVENLESVPLDANLANVLPDAEDAPESVLPGENREKERHVENLENVRANASLESVQRKVVIKYTV